MEDAIKHVVVVGGGITGLSAAYYMRKYSENRGIPLKLTVVEKAERMGGKIRTLRRDGCVIEQGPDSFMARKLPALTLTKELGLMDELTATNPQAKQNYILRKGKLHPMPLGFVLGVPTAITPFLKTGLVSPLGKARAALDLILPRSKSREDESLGGFIERRLGKEVLRQITEPLFAGIYAGDTNALSLQATFPQFRQLEQKHRSLILGLAAGKKQKSGPAGSTDELPEIAKRSLFLTYKGGLSTLINRLLERLDRTHLITGCGVTSLSRDAGGHRVELDNGSMLQADGVILATPAYAAASLLPDIEALDWMKRVPYVSVANVVLAYRKADIGRPLKGSGFVVPSREGRTITACTWISSKWLHTAPEDTVLLRAYIGRAGAEEWTKMPDEQLLRRVRQDLRETMGLEAEPLFHEVTRLKQSMPQYPVGHLEELKRVRMQLAEERPGIMLCGAGYEGVGIPDCIEQGRKAAEQMAVYCSQPFD